MGSQIEAVNQKKKLYLTDMQIHTEAERIFVAVGRRLKNRRFDDDADSMYSYLKEEETDPARNDGDLHRKLVEQGKVAKEKLDRVFEEFVDKQASGMKGDDGDDNSSDDCSMDEEYDEEKVKEYERNLANYDKMVSGEGGGASTSSHPGKSNYSKSDEVLSDVTDEEANDDDIIELDNSCDVDEDNEVNPSDDSETKGVESDIEGEDEYKDSSDRTGVPVGVRRTSESLDSLLDSDGEDKE